MVQRMIAICKVCPHSPTCKKNSCTGFEYEGGGPLTLAEQDMIEAWMKNNTVKNYQDGVNKLRPLG